MNGGTVVIDACLAITFGSAGALDVVSKLSLHHVAMAKRAFGEILKQPTLGVLQAAVTSGSIVIESIDLSNSAEQDALVRFDARPAFKNRGEAEVLALAVSRGYIVGSDERPVRTSALKELGVHRVATTLDFLVWAIREGRLTLVQAESLVQALDVGPQLVKALAASGKVLKDLI